MVIEAYCLKDMAAVRVMWTGVAGVAWEKCEKRRYLIVGCWSDDERMVVYEG